MVYFALIHLSHIGQMIITTENPMATLRLLALMPLFFLGGNPCFAQISFKKALSVQSRDTLRTTNGALGKLRTPPTWPLPGHDRVAPTQRAWSQLNGRRLLAPELTGEVRVMTSKKTGLPLRITGQVDYPGASLRSTSAEEHAYAYLNHLRTTLNIDEPQEEFRLVEQFRDDLGQEHIRLQQYWQGIEMWGSEILLHRRDGRIDLFHGRYQPSPRYLDLEPALTGAQAVEWAMQDLKDLEKVVPFGKKERFLAGEQIQGLRLVIYHEKEGGAPRLCWYLEAAAHPLSRWAYFVDARSGAIVHRYNLVCTFHTHVDPATGHAPHTADRPTGINTVSGMFDGPATANAIDVLGVPRTINTYEIQGQYLLMDASRPMYDAARSEIPDNPVGAILTLDARNTTPQDGEAYYMVSNDNTWSDRSAVSAHYNAGIAYEYYRSTFNRSSINGQGGTIFSIVNIADEDGGGLDNAFWNGQFMFYGNGRRDFAPLAGALDVGAHEMTHGVIQNTANLEYQGESGALNESFADVFGVLIDRDDWTLGEDVVISNTFPTGALRDMANPNNGGRQLGDPGWQPANVSEQYRGELNNGGVHINSGIPNRAFYLFATEVGLEKAEQVYYRVLTTYLTRQSQFVDMRMAVMDAAADLYGQAEVEAAANAFSAVGILGDGTTQPDEPTEAPVNPGQQYVAVVGSNGFGLYILDTQGNPIQGGNPLINEEIISPPSISDDGSVIVWVNGANELRYVVIDWDQGVVLDNDVLSTDNVWRRAAISKDAERIAVVTAEENDFILIFDFATQQQQTFELYNPTFTQGITSDEVQFADAMEWDISSTRLIYDAFNEVSGFGQGYAFWDIGILNVWDPVFESFADGNISKLFTQLPQGITVGNPSVAKNSPNIIAFDYLDENLNDLAILGYDLLRNEVGVIFENNVISYPSYSTDDRFMVFNAQAQTGNAVVGILELAEDKISAFSQGSVFVEGAQWPVWFATGDRVTDLSAPPVMEEETLRVFPNPVRDMLRVELTLRQATPLQLELLDPLGRVLRQWQENAPSGVWQQTYTLPAVTPGAYLLRVRADRQVLTRTIICTARRK